MTLRRFSIQSSVAVCIAMFAAHSSVARADEPEPKADDESTVKTVVFELASDRMIVRRGTEETTVRIGCVARSFTSLKARAYVLCGASTIIVIDAEPLPHVLTRQRLVEPILSLTMINDVVSARTETGVKPLHAYTVATVLAEGGTNVDADALPTHKKNPPRKYGHDDDAKRARQLESQSPTGFELDATVTGGVGVDNHAGAFSILDTAFIYRFKFPFSISAYGMLGAATGSFDTGFANEGPHGGDVQLATGEILASFDSRIFSIGAGVGVGLFESAYAVEPLIVARGRLGEIDVFEFRWHMSFATSGQDLIGVFGSALEFRLSPKWWLGADAEFGNLRYGRFMLTARRRLIAQHDRKGPVLDLRAGLGLTYVQTSSVCNTSFTGLSTGDSECIGTNAEYMGPGVSLGLVFRP